MPLYPDNMVKILLKAFHRLEKLNLDIHIVPTSIDYERIFDVSYLSNEIIKGEFNPKTTIVDIIKKVMQMRKGKLGKIFVKYGDAISLKEYFKQH